MMMRVRGMGEAPPPPEGRPPPPPGDEWKPLDTWFNKWILVGALGVVGLALFAGGVIDAQRMRGRRR